MVLAALTKTSTPDHITTALEVLDGMPEHGVGPDLVGFCLVASAAHLRQDGALAQGLLDRAGHVG